MQKTYDDADRMAFFTPGKISNRQSLTNEGFLLCEEVPIARTGIQDYMESEMPDDIKGDKDGIVKIHRDPEEVFRPETIASFNGKPVTNDHPMFGVDPNNWNDLAVGTMQNVRRGEGIYDDFLFADLLITNKEAIQAIRDGKREVSCGYDADYEQTEPGHGRQLNIIGNHVALVDKGRCGPRCAIQDQHRSTKMNWRDKILALVGKDNKAAVSELLEGVKTNDEGAGGIHLHLGGSEKDDEEEKPVTRKEFDELMGAVKGMTDEFKAYKDGKAKDKESEEEEEELEEDAEGTEEEKNKKVSDHLAMIVSRSEILSPGFKVNVKTSDCACKSHDDRKKVFKDLLGVKRKVLDTAYRTEDGKAAIEPFLQGKIANFDKLGARTVDVIFVGASEMLRQKRNNDASTRKITSKDFSPSKVTTADINKQNSDFWNKPRG